jgi:hypothetical protein
VGWQHLEASSPWQQALRSMFAWLWGFCCGAAAGLLVLVLRALCHKASGRRGGVKPRRPRGSGRYDPGPPPPSHERSQFPRALRLKKRVTVAVKVDPEAWRWWIEMVMVSKWVRPTVEGHQHFNAGLPPHPALLSICLLAKGVIAVPGQRTKKVLQQVRH